MLAKNADFRRLYLGQLISFAGDWFLVVPLIGLVYEASGSPLAAAAVIAAQALPALLLAPVTGAVADRFDRKKIMVITDVVRALLVLSLLAADSVGTIWFPLLIMARLGTHTAPLLPPKQ